MKLLKLILPILILTASQAYAQDIRVTASGPSTIDVGQTASFNVTTDPNRNLRGIDIDGVGSPSDLALTTASGEPGVTASPKQSSFGSFGLLFTQAMASNQGALPASVGQFTVRFDKVGLYTINLTANPTLDTLGATVTPTINPTVQVNVTLPRDLNGDGRADVFDAELLRSFLRGLVPSDPLFDRDGSGEINLVDYLTYIDEIFLPQTQTLTNAIANANAIVSDNQGGYYVTTRNLEEVVHYEANGTISTVPHNLPNLGRLQGVAFDGIQTLYVSSASRHVIYAINLSNGDTQVVAGILDNSGNTDGALGVNQLNAPIGIVLQGIQIFVCDAGNSSIRALDISLNSVSTFSASGFSSPSRIALDSNGDVHVAANGMIYRVQTSNTFLVYSGAIPAAALRFDSNDRLFILSSLNNAVYEIDNGGNEILIAGNNGPGNFDAEPLLASFDNPIDLLVEGNSIIVSERGNGTLRVVPKP